jgi:poly-gamma-glutamate capsule biosynthesis protein CapA/YwtB (metallophosphatase superfamily)
MLKSDNHLVKIFIIVALIIAASGIVFYLNHKNYSLVEDLPRHVPRNVPQTTTIFLAGDIMLSRNVAAAMYKANDFTLPFQKIADVTKSADIAFANLESPFNDTGDHSVEGSLIFNGDPKSIDGLTYAGIDILSTANNHTLDQRYAGLTFTYKFLVENHIIPIGTTTACHSGQIITKNNVKFGFLAYSYTAKNDGGKTIDSEVCDANNLKQLKLDIINLKAKSDIVIVSMHAGTEYVREPNTLQTSFAQAASDAGADIVVGAHPHWIQKPIEKIGDKTWVFYSLGNFVFDQMWSQDTREGMTVLLTFKDKTLDKIELKPIIIDNYCCPRWANEEETKAILNKINLTSPIL